MKVAVLSLTRDRLDYTKHCFASLWENAGCEYDHYVLDNGSIDGTAEWLATQPFHVVCGAHENLGISRALNDLLRVAEREGSAPFDPYDVIVKFDNDCELTQPNTLRDIAQLVIEGDCILSPRILGLQNPPQATRELRIGAEIILDVPQIGGIFLAAPAWVYDEFRYSEKNPPWGMDDVEICAWFREQGGTCGYVKRLEAWHYLGTDGQRADQPDYFARKDAEYAR